MTVNVSRWNFTDTTVIKRYPKRYLNDNEWLLELPEIQHCEIQSSTLHGTIEISHTVGRLPILLNF